MGSAAINRGEASPHGSRPGEALHGWAKLRRKHLEQKNTSPHTHRGLKLEVWLYLGDPVWARCDPRTTGPRLRRG